MFSFNQFNNIDTLNEYEITELELTKLINSVSECLNNFYYNEMYQCMKHNNLNAFIFYFKQIKIKNIQIINRLCSKLYEYDSLNNIDNNFYILLFKYMINDKLLFDEIFNLLFKLYNTKDITFINYFNKMNKLIILLHNKYNIKFNSIIDLIYYYIDCDNHKEMLNYIINNIKYNTLLYSIKNTNNINLIKYIFIQKILKENTFNINDFYIIKYILDTYSNYINIFVIINKITDIIIFYNLIKNCNKFIDYPLIQKLLYLITKISLDENHPVNDFLNYFLNDIFFENLNQFKYIIKYNNNYIHVSLIHLLLYNPNCNNNHQNIDKLFKIIYKYTQIMNDHNNIYNLYPIQLALYNKNYNIITEIINNYYLSKNIDFNIITNKYNLIKYFILNQYDIYTIKNLIHIFNYDIINTFDKNKENLLILLLRYYNYDKIKECFTYEILSFGIIKWIQYITDKI